MKTARTVFVLLAFVSFALLPLVSAVPKHQLQQLNLKYTTDNPQVVASPLWVNMPGNEISDFKMKLDDSVPYYYIDVRTLREIKDAKPIPTPGLGFRLTSRTVDDATWDAFWASKGAAENGAPWQELLWNIKEGNVPIFYLDITEEHYGLIDGFGFLYYHVWNTLRVDGNYPLGTYTYHNNYMDWDITITFK